MFSDAAANFASVPTPAMRQRFDAQDFMNKNRLCALVGAFEFFSSEPDGADAFDESRVCARPGASGPGGGGPGGGPGGPGGGPGAPTPDQDFDLPPGVTLPGSGTLPAGGPTNASTTAADDDDYDYTSGCVGHGYALHMFAVTIACRVLLL